MNINIIISEVSDVFNGICLYLNSKDEIEHFYKLFILYGAREKEDEERLWRAVTR